MAKSVIQCLKDIAYRLNLIADYVVETGTSGIWKYEKWASGKAVLNGVYTLASGTFAATGSVYYRTVNNLLFPTDFFADVPYHVSGAIQMGNVGAFSGYTVTKNALNFSVLSAVSTARAVTFDFEVKGLWKQLGGVVRHIIWRWSYA